MSEKFNKLVVKYNEDLTMIKGDSPEYIKKLQTFYPFIVALYPTELDNVFTKCKLKNEISNWKVAKEMVGSVDSFSIDYENNTILIELGDAKLEQELVDVKQYVKTEFNLIEDSWEFNLALSFFCDPMNFEMFQITKLIQE